jgi:hypothetical protein
VLLLFGGLSLQPSRRQPLFTSALRVVSCIVFHHDPGRFSKVSPHDLSICHSRILLTSRVVVSDANATMQVLSSTRMGSRR